MTIRLSDRTEKVLRGSQMNWVSAGPPDEDSPELDMTEWVAYKAGVEGGQGFQFDKNSKMHVLAAEAWAALWAARGYWIFKKGESYGA